MGLDMYLSARRYIGGYEFMAPAQRENYAALVEAAKASDLVDPNTPSAYVEVTCAYWRKANQIHGWFVRNVQNNVDECQKSPVSRTQLISLRDLCRDLLLDEEDNDPEITMKVTKRLPPMGGFFFGSTEIDEDYWGDLRRTVIQLERALKADEEWEFDYRSSW